MEFDDLERLATSAYLIGATSSSSDASSVSTAHIAMRRTGRAPRAARSGSASACCSGARPRSPTHGSRGASGSSRGRTAWCGYLLLSVTEQQLRDGAIDLAYTTATAAAAIGDRFRDADLAAAARHVQGAHASSKGTSSPGWASSTKRCLQGSPGSCRPS